MTKVIRALYVFTSSTFSDRWLPHAQSPTFPPPNTLLPRRQPVYPQPWLCLKVQPARLGGCQAFGLKSIPLTFSSPTLLTTHCAPYGIILPSILLYKQCWMRSTHADGMCRGRCLRCLPHHYSRPTGSRARGAVGSCEPCALCAATTPRTQTRSTSTHPRQHFA